MSRIHHIKPFSKQQLLAYIIQSINDCDFNIIHTSTINDHPFKLRIYKNEENYNLKIYIWNMSHGGGYKRPINEYRIQISGVRNFSSEPNTKTLILGYWQEANVFAGFDFNKHKGEIGVNASFQIKSDNLEKAAISGFSPCNKGNGEIAIAFRPDFFVEYIRNIELLHTFGESQRDFAILEKVTENEIVPNEEMIQQVSITRQTTIQTISKKQRDISFRARVLRAYGYRCAFSGIQLKLVDAAHIVPVSHESSTDKTSNGIALSPIHHKAYDKGLITFNEKYQIVLNEKEVNTLKEFRLDGGLDKFIKGLRPIIDAPPALTDRPNINYVKLANRLRGWHRSV